MQFNNEFVTCTVSFLDSLNIKITGVIKNRQKYKNVLLLAPNPIDKTASYSGKGLPFPCADIAFEDTPNLHLVPSETINVEFKYPNSYYTVANKTKVISSIFFVLEPYDGEKDFVRFELKDQYPLRTLVNRESRTGPEFYAKKFEILPIDTAEVIMKEYSKAKIMYNIA
jgi:hypothetical protein